MWKRAIASGALLALVALVPAAHARPGAAGDVTVTEETFVDESRPTAAGPTTPASDVRTLETVIAYPVAQKKGKQLPLVVLAHGYNGNPRKFMQLMTAWAEAGYVVAAPQFPLTNDVTNRGGPVGDVANQPADVSFVIDEMLRLDKAKGSDLRGRIDPRRIGLAGLSLGGFTTYGAVFNTCCRDDRIDAAIVMSAVRGPFAGGDYDFLSVPVLVMHAEADTVYSQSVEVFPLLAPPKWFVTLHGGTALRHATPFEDTADPADELVRDATTAFLDLTLKDRPRAARRLREAAQPADGSATLQEQTPENV